MQKTELVSPIFVIGAARSGTSFLAESLASHPDLAYWCEAKYVWRYRDPLAQDDRRTAAAATPEVQRYIHQRFQRFLSEQAPARRLLEKTPSNCFRLPFIEALFPDARYLVLLRDGRAVTQSARRKWAQPREAGVFLRRLRQRDIPLRDLLLYVPEILRELLRRQLVRQPRHLWGPWFPGIRDFLEQYGEEATCAMQWRQSVEQVAADLAAIPQERQLLVRYEDFCADPRPQLARILSFLDLTPSPAVEQAVLAGLAAHRAPERPNLQPATEDILKPCLRQWGYERDNCDRE